MDALELTPGTLINGLYRMVRVLGVGGMGEVWEARHERTKGRVAIKLLLPEMGRHDEVLQRFQREAEITSGLNHPNIVRVTDFDRLSSGRPFLAMEFLEGHDLSNVAQMRATLSVAQALEIIEQTATGLQAAHAHQIVHRDLKPANIFLVPLPGTTRVVIKILDFGISKALDGISNLTQTSNVLGTPNYMAPEQATKGVAALDARADQFSLAAIAYELLTGRLAFEGDGVMNVLYKVVNEEPPSFSSLGVAVAPGLEAVVRRGLSKSAADRFGSVLEFSDALKLAASSGRAQSSPFSAGQTVRLPSSRISTTLRASVGEMSAVAETAVNRDGASKRRRIAVLTGGGALAAVVVGLAVMRGSSGPPDTNTPAAASASIAVKPVVTTSAVLPVSAPLPAPAPVVLEPPKPREPGPHGLPLPVSTPDRTSARSVSKLVPVRHRDSPGAPKRSKDPTKTAAPLNDDL